MQELKYNSYTSPIEDVEATVNDADYKQAAMEICDVSEEEAGVAQCEDKYCVKEKPVDVCLVEKVSPGPGIVIN